MKKMSFSQRCSLVYPEPEGIETEAIGYPKLVEKVVDGKIVQQVEFVIDEPNDKEFEFKDFALENLLASGADLKEMKFTSMSLHAADEFVRQSENFKLNPQNVE